MSKRVSPTLIGGFVVGAVALVLVGVTVFGSGRLFRRTYKFVVYFEGSVNGLNIGAPVKFKGVEVGSVSDIRLDLPGEKRDMAGLFIPVVIKLDAGRINKKGGRADLSDPATLNRLIEQGLRAQLNMESLVTGLLYVALDLHPETPINLVRAPDLPYPEIPTIPTAFEQMQSASVDLVAKLRQLDFERLINSATDTVESVNRLFNSPQVKSIIETLDKTIRDLDDAITGIHATTDALAPQIAGLATDLRETSRKTDRTLVQALATLRRAEAFLQEDAPTVQRLDRALSEIADAARALRVLADYLERNPRAVLVGKHGPEDEQ